MSGQFLEKITDGGGWKNAHPNVLPTRCVTESNSWHLASCRGGMSARPVPLGVTIQRPECKRDHQDWSDSHWGRADPGLFNVSGQAWSIVQHPSGAQRDQGDLALFRAPVAVQQACATGEQRKATGTGSSPFNHSRCCMQVSPEKKKKKKKKIAAESPRADGYLLCMAAKAQTLCTVLDIYCYNRCNRPPSQPGLKDTSQNSILRNNYRGYQSQTWPLGMVIYYLSSAFRD